MSHGRPTLADVAFAAGVSVSTASLAFSGAGPIAPETRTRVLDAAPRLGYAGPNPLGRSLRSGRSGIVAVVGVEDRAGTAELARYLTGLGHTRIGCVALPFTQPRRTGVATPDRLAALEWAPARHRMQGLADAGVEPVMIVETAGSLVEEGRAAGRLLLDVPEPPTAVLAQSDLLAAGVLLAARELGLRVPEDVSVAGFDGLDLPWMAPDVLTTVAQPLGAKGEAIGRAVEQVLAGELPATVRMPVSLRVGTTTGPPRS